MPAKNTVSPLGGSGRALFLLYSFLLLVTITVDVHRFMPIYSPIQLKRWVSMHQGPRNFLIAKKMIAGLLTQPPTRWSVPIKLDELGQGAWYAEGVVDLKAPSGQVVATQWKAIFIPETAQSLYLAVGSQYKGDFKEAVRTAGVQPQDL